jgi:ABC-type multidrug transport system ATPase subunit
VHVVLCMSPFEQDPYSRRATWELLRRCKQGRTLLLTTHFSKTLPARASQAGTTS